MANTFDFKIDTNKITGTAYGIELDNPDGITIDWGDTNSSNVSDALNTEVLANHTYDSEGEYTIKVSGTATRVQLGQGFGDIANAVTDILTLPSDGVTGITSGFLMFAYNDNLQANLTANLNNWNTGNINSMRNMFTFSSFNQNIGNWDVSSVTNMQGLFRDTPFNQDIGNWDVSSGESMQQIFWDNTVFNQDIGNWDVSSATTMQSMFQNNTVFDQDLSKWCVPLIATEPSSFGGSTTWTDKPVWGECSYPHIKFNEQQDIVGVNIKVYSDSARTTLVGETNTGGGGHAPVYLSTGTFYYTASKTDYLDTEDSLTIGSCTSGTDCENVFGTESFTMTATISGEISGTVKLGSGVENATVRIFCQDDNSLLAEKTTDAQGEFKHEFGIPDTTEEKNKRYHAIVEYIDGEQKYHAYSLWDIDPLNLAE